MTAAAPRHILRPGPGGSRQAIERWIGDALPLVFSVLRTIWPIPRLGRNVVATRHDHVREVFLNDAAFGVPYGRKLDVMMRGERFFLGMGDTEQYRSDTAALRRVVPPSDISARLAPEAERLATAAVEAAGGEIDVVDALVRRVTFALFSDYLGVPEPPGEKLALWGTRLFEFVFGDARDDPALRAEVDAILPAFHDHLQAEIVRRRSLPELGDDVLGRCLALQRLGEPGFADARIRTNLLGLLAGGPPQPPIVLPQALEQLLRRTEALAGAQDAARRNDDASLAGYVFEAMRFDPLAPGLQRIALADAVIGAGTRHARHVPQGANVFAAFSSAMMDGRRVPDPRRFDPRRRPHEYIHFGHGLHTCFAVHINQAVLPLILKPLLKQPRLRRAPGIDGRLTKRGLFAERLVVRWG